MGKDYEKGKDWAQIRGLQATLPKNPWVTTTPTRGSAAAQVTAHMEETAKSGHYDKLKKIQDSMVAVGIEVPEEIAKAIEDL